MREVKWLESEQFHFKVAVGAHGHAGLSQLLVGHVDQAAAGRALPLSRAPACDVLFGLLNDRPILVRDDLPASGPVAHDAPLAVGVLGCVLDSLVKLSVNVAVHTRLQNRT